MSRRSAPPRRLTPREREVLDLVGQGKTDAEIARTLRISFRTVRTHLERVSSRFGLSGRAALAMLTLTSFGEAGSAYLGDR